MKPTTNVVDNITGFAEVLANTIVSNNIEVTAPNEAIEVIIFARVKTVPLSTPWPSNHEARSNVIVIVSVVAKATIMT